MTNEQLLETAQEAINNLFADTSVSADKCRENLKSLIDEIEILIESLDFGDDEEEL